MRVLDWLFRDRRTGRWVVAQFPNAPLLVFLVAFVAALALPSGSTPRRIADWVATAALAWWAVDEVARGVNPFRRLLGGVVLAFVAIGVLMRLL